MSAVNVDVLDALAGLVQYPHESPSECANRCLGLLDPADPARSALQRFAQRAAAMPLPALQEHYTAVFDFDPACALDLGWHLFGDSRERGGFLSVLREDLARLNVAETSELPDHVSHVLALLGREEAYRRAALADLVAPAIASLRTLLQERGSVYADLFAAIDSLAGKPATDGMKESTTP
jgi:nitrate reductase delta subunit